MRNQPNQSGMGALGRLVQDYQETGGANTAGFQEGIPSGEPGPGLTGKDVAGFIGAGILGGPIGLVGSVAGYESNRQNPNLEGRTGWSAVAHNAWDAAVAQREYAEAVESIDFDAIDMAGSDAGAGLGGGPGMGGSSGGASGVGDASPEGMAGGFEGFA